MIQIQENILLKDFTTFHIGGLARYFVIIHDVEELKEAVNFAKDKQLSLLVLGGGSNVLISDSGFSGLVIKNEIKKKEILADSTTVIFGAGEGWDEAVEFTISHSLFGLENLSGVPGTVGAAPVQNIGAYGSEIKDTLLQVKVLNTDNNQEEIFKNNECQFAYRYSIFKKEENKKYIITEVYFNLNKYLEDDQARLNIGYKDLKNYFAENSTLEVNLNNIRKAVLEIRKGKFPNMKEFGLAGSFYKNPIISQIEYEKLTNTYKDLPSFPAGDGFVKIPIAWIIDHVLHLKGYKIGHVGVHEKHALALLNLGGASAKEILDLSDYVKRKVKEKTGIEIEEEVESIK